MSDAPRRSLEPFLDRDAAIRLADAINALPIPQYDGEIGVAPSDEFVEGFEEAKRLAIAVTQACAGIRT